MSFFNVGSIVISGGVVTGGSPTINAPDPRLVALPATTNNQETAGAEPPLPTCTSSAPPSVPHIPPLVANVAPSPPRFPVPSPPAPALANDHRLGQETSTFPTYQHSPPPDSLSSLGSSLGFRGLSTYNSEAAEPPSILFRRGVPTDGSESNITPFRPIGNPLQRSGRVRRIPEQIPRPCAPEPQFTPPLPWAGRPSTGGYGNVPMPETWPKDDRDIGTVTDGSVYSHNKFD